MKVDVLPIGLYQENSYVLHDHDHVLFIDPGRYAKQIAACVSEKETVDGVILTHTHSDHIKGLGTPWHTMSTRYKFFRKDLPTKEFSPDV